MEISCDIIRDLLPLYAEDMVSLDSRNLVDDHLCRCDACTKALGVIQKQMVIPVESDPKPLNMVKKGIRKRRLLSVLAALLTLVTLTSFAITYLFAPFQLTKDQALDDFYVREDGAVVIDYSSSVIGRHLSGSGENWFINQYSTRYDMWKGDNRKSIEELFGSDGVITEEERQRYENIDVVYGNFRSVDGKVKSDAPIPWLEDAVQVSGGSDWNWWYADPTGRGGDILLHDAGKEYPAYREGYSPVYPLIFFGGSAAAVILAALRKLLNRKRLKDVACSGIILCTSAAASTLFVSSGRLFTSTVGIIDQYWGPMIAVNTVLLTLTFLFCQKCYVLNRQDKGL